MNLADVTPLIITYNEIDNIRRSLAALSWARRIVVVDSGSTDGTVEILRATPGVEVVIRPFDDFATQCSAGLARIKTRYTLSLDADHVVTPQLVEEMSAVEGEGAAGWLIPFSYCVNGVPLRGSLLPPRVALFQTDRGAYENDGHAHRISVDGPRRQLRNPLLHDDRKPPARWYDAQRKYLPQEASKLASMSWTQLSWPDRARRLFLGPLLVVPYCLFFKGLLLDGTAGLYYTYQRLYAESLLALMLARRLAN